MTELPEKVQRVIEYLITQTKGKGVIVLFGSQVQQKKKTNADFDIGILLNSPLSWRTFSIWKLHCEDLAWPYRIDLVDLSRAPKEFLETVEQQMVVLHGQWHPPSGTDG